MASMTIDELKAEIQQLGFDDNAKVVVLVGKTAGGKYQIVQVNDDGKLVTTT